MKKKSFRTTSFALLLLLGLCFLFEARATCQIIGWGYNLAGEVTGVPSIHYSTNRAEFENQFKDTAKIVTGVIKVSGQMIIDPAAIAAGYAHGLTLKKDGTVYGWGWNQFGQATGVPTVSELHVSSGPVTIANRPLTNVVAIAAGRTHSIALKADGTVVVWGALNSGRTIDTPPGISNIVAVAAGWDSSLALRHDGTVIGWNMRVPEGLSNIVAISASAAWGGQILALESDGTVLQWNNRQPAIIVKGLSKITAIAAGVDHNLALGQDGSVFSWTQDIVNPVTIDGQPLTNAMAVSAGDGFSLALKSNSTVVAWGKIGWQLAMVPAGLNNIVAISAGEGFCLAITTNNAVLEKYNSDH